MRSLFRVEPTTFLVFALLTSGSALAQKAPSKAVLQDASTYAEMHHVSLEEGLRRFRIQSIVGNIEPELAKEPSFAGIWLEHEPAFRVVASFTDLAAAKRVLPVDDVEGELEIRRARWSLEQLEQDLASAIARSNSLGFVVDGDINIQKNQAEILVVEDRETSALRDAQREMAPSVVIIGVEQLAKPQVDGGENITNCTGGFTVKNSWDEYGISTAGHCPPGQTVDGFVLPHQQDTVSGSVDAQWNSTCDIVDVSDDFDSGAGMRDVSGTISRANQAVGAFVCKFGVTTGRTCGNIDSKNYSPAWVDSPASTFIRVDAGGANLSDDGDSGGPWYNGNIAYGIHSGGAAGQDAVYMAIDYISALGISVLTTDPSFSCTVCIMGPCTANSDPCCSGWCLPSGLGGISICQ